MTLWTKPRSDLTGKWGQLIIFDKQDMHRGLTHTEWPAALFGVALALDQRVSQA